MKWRSSWSGNEIFIEELIREENRSTIVWSLMIIVIVQARSPILVSVALIRNYSCDQAKAFILSSVVSLSVVFMLLRIMVVW
jgi:hypothetical protein